MAKLDNELKAAILRMPVKEKDKLLLRLVAKDEKLVRRLIFELLEHSATADERAAGLRRTIEENLPASGSRHLTPGLLLMELRRWNGRITEHVQATKDKLGEVVLTIYLFNEAFRRHWDMLNRSPTYRSDTLAPYVVKRTVMLLKKAEKLHEDYYMEFRRELQELLAFIWNFKATAVWARELGLPKQWEG
jgi:hypothetical protein